MSSKIDERVVKMTFNSGDFQKGVAETSGALDRLKSALRIDGNNPALDGLTSKVAAAGTAFQGLQTVAVGALLTIGASVVQLGQKIVTDLTQNLTKGARDGFKEYETQINAIATILGNTKSKGENMESINAALEELNTYSDKTIYNFTEMVSGIKTLTNAGVGLKEGVAVVKGYANAAALAGVSSEEMARGMEFGLNQAIQKGYLGIQDFTSVQSVMGEQFKNSLMETARLHGTNVDELIAKNGSFRDSLSEGWVTAEVITETLAKFTGELSDEQLKSMGYTDQQIVKIQEMAKTAVTAATKVRTFTQLLGTIAEQIGSGWAGTWRLILGDADQAKALFTGINDELSSFVGASNDARNSQLELWAEMGGREALVEAIGYAFDALHGVMDPIAEAWHEVFPPSLGKTLAAISFAIRDFVKGLILSEDAQANLKMVATGLFKVLKFGVDIIMGIGKVFGFLVGVVFDLGGALLGLLTPVLTFVRSLLPIKEGADEATSGVTNFFDMLVNAGGFLTGWLPDAIRNLGGLLNDFLNNGEAAARVKDFAGTMKGLADTFAMVWNVLAKGDFTSNPFFAEDSKFVDVLFNIREGIVTVVDAFKTFFGVVGEAADRAGSFWGGLLSAIQGVWSKIKPIVGEVKKFFGDVASGLDIDTILAGINAGVLIAAAVSIGKFLKKIGEAFSFVSDFQKGLLNGLDGLTGVLEGYQNKLKAESLLKIAAAILVLAGALWILSTIDPNRLISAVTAMATSFGILLGGLAILDKINAEPSIKASVALSLIAIAVNILATAVAKLGALDAEQLSRGLMGVAAVMLMLVIAAQQMDGMEGSIVKSAAAMILMATAITVIAGAVALFGIMPMDMIVQGFIAVGIALAMLVGAAVILSKFAPEMALSAVGLMAMAAALNMLVIPITLLGLLPLPILIQGMSALGIILFGLVLAAQQLSAIAPQMALAAVGMMAMAFALNMLVAPITLLGMLPLATLIIGLAALAIMLTILVIATNAMTTAMPGAVAMIAVAAALLVLSVALAIMAGIGLVGIIEAIFGLVLAVMAMAIISGIITPLIPAMAGVAGAMALFALGMLALAVALMIGTLAIAMLGPALMLAVGGLQVFADASGDLLGAAGPMAVLGAALIVFGAGAIVAGVGAMVLGAGLIVLGLGLLLIAAVGILGAVALAKVIEKISTLLVHIPGMLAMGAAMVVLGAGVIVLGAGLIVLGAGAILAAIALMMLIPLGALVTLSITMIIKALERLAPMSEEVGVIGDAMKKLGSATTKLASSGQAAANGLVAMSTSFTTLASGASVAGLSIQMLAAIVAPSIAKMIASIQKGPAAFQQFAIAVALSMTMLNAGLVAGASKAQITASKMGKIVGSTLVVAIAASYLPVYMASVNLGTQMTAGMNRGLQNGSYSVSNMAALVARRALNAAKTELGVASPSKEFTWLGEMSGEGLANGLVNNMGMVDKAGTEVAGAALSAVQQTLLDMKNAVASDMELTPSIRPVLDMSAVKKEASLLGGMLTPPSLKVADSYAMASSLSSQRRANEQEAALISAEEANSRAAGDTYIQNNYSPKAISAAETYRNTKNLISVKKGESPT